MSSLESRSRKLLKLLDQLDPAIAELDRAVLEQARRREDAVLLMTHPGIGPNMALAYVLAIGPVSRFLSAERKWTEDMSMETETMKFQRNMRNEANFL